MGFRYFLVALAALFLEIQTLVCFQSATLSSCNLARNTVIVFKKRTGEWLRLMFS